MDKITKHHRGRRKHRQHKKTILLFALLIVCVASVGGVAMAIQSDSPAFHASPVSFSATLPEINFTDGTTAQIADTAQFCENLTRNDYEVAAGNPPKGEKTETEKVVYLTLDDGPSKNTEAVLDILDRYNAKATFFVTNLNPNYQYLIKEEYDRGHTIGLHTYSHDYAKVYASQEAYFKDLDAIGQVVKEQIGYVPCFIRFPGGSSNAISKKYSTGIMTALSSEVQKRGYQYYDWNCSSGDGSNLDTASLVKNATGSNASVVVLLSHDANGKQTTVEALPQIIEYYQSKGYVFKALDRDSYAPHHGINN